MIRLDIQEYCNNCRDFDPVLAKSHDEEDSKEYQTLVRCKWNRRCDQIRSYIERTLKNGVNSSSSKGE